MALSLLGVTAACVTVPEYYYCVAIPFTCSMTSFVLIGDVLTVHLYCPRSFQPMSPSLRGVLSAVLPADVPDLKVPLGVVLSHDTESRVVDHCLVLVRQRHRVAVQPRHLSTIPPASCNVGLRSVQDSSTPGQPT